MASSTILLSTYNGEKYLADQIESILAQTDHDWKLLIRDDGSCDKTNSIIDQYTQNYPDKINRLTADKNLGVVGSFGALLQACDTDYMFLCDQDDVWLPTKIEDTKRKMIEVECQYPNTPVGIYTDLRVVDENLQTIRNSFWEYSRIEPSLLTSFDYLCVHPAATGCTVMINRLAKEISLPLGKDVRMHDAWIMLSILKNNGKVDYIRKQTMLYRQHSNNVVGAIDENDSYLMTRIKGIRAVVKNNKSQWKMISKLGFSSPLKYLWIKVCYQYKYNSLRKASEK